MSGKLDQSLDEILTNQRRNQQGRRRSQRRTAAPTRPTTTAPAGGIQKNTKPARGATKPTPAKGAGVSGESKIMVSNLPKDVSEGQIKALTPLEVERARLSLHTIRVAWQAPVIQGSCAGTKGNGGKSDIA
ncbi:hypothetical protein NEMBOFW57_009832 [Staphylotrichum longicolle]|uniref:Uncharacterized protein n=1 Tax=Staphylotrichum longicolle TaxID=669026 RepID=A0AAD4HVS6_9PEZI|nr:hypothetical protein NEMBOFW57_009832 [Staphylotrichum longicolle]